jgi:hypothetical protein
MVDVLMPIMMGISRMGLAQMLLAFQAGTAEYICDRRDTLP